MTEPLQFYGRLIHSLEGEWILLSALLFMAGLFLAPVVVGREIRVLLWYPLWLWRRVKRWVHPDDPFFKMVITILFLNATSLLVNILSGLTGVMPFVFALLLGLHVAIIVIKETGGRNLIALFLNPVAFLELPATWVSLSLGMELGVSQLHRFSFSESLPLLWKGMLVYGTLILPLLAVAALVEVSLVKGSQRLDRQQGNQPPDTSC